MAKRGTLVALTPSQVEAVLSVLDGATGIICRLAYSTGLRMTEVLRLRIRDIDLGANRIAHGRYSETGKPCHHTPAERWATVCLGVA